MITSESDSLFRSKYEGLVGLLDSLDAVVYAADMQTHELLFVNAAARAISGGDVGDKCWQVMQSGQSGPCAFCSNDKLLDAQGLPADPYVWEFQNTVDGNWYQCRDQAIRWTDGRLVRLEVAINITDRVRIEKALQKSEKDLRNIIDASFEAIFISKDGICLDQNLTAEKMFGYAKEEAIGRSATEWVVPEDRELVLDNISGGYEQPYEITALRKDGTTFSAEIQARMISYQGNPVRMTALRDISERKKAEEKIRAQEKRFKAFFSSINDVVLVHPLQEKGFGSFIEVNDTACERYGYSHDDFKHMTIEDLNEEMVIESDEAGAVRKKLVEEKRLVIESMHVKKSGEKFPVEVSATVIDLGNKPVILSVIRDISDRKKAEEEARGHQERFKAFFSSLNDAVFVHPLQSEGFAPFVEVNDTACRHYGYTREEFLQMTAEDITKKMLIEQHATGRHRQTLLEEKKMVFEAIHIKKSGEEFPVEINANIVYQHGTPMVIAVVRDITERKKAEEKIEHMAFYDALTDLPNRALFVEQLRIALQNYQRDNEPFAIHMLDLDHFKDVNDSLGHPLGDALLAAVADRIRGVVRSSDIFARLGGDEFVLIQAQYRDLTDVSNLAEKIIEEVGQDFEIEGHSIWINVSIGIVVNDNPETTVNDLLSQVDSALYKAKDAGRGTYAFYEDAMTLSLQREFELSRELSRAIGHQELFVEYQPQVDLADGHLVGMEALVRWRHPMRGKLLPGDFLAIAEKRGLIRELSNWVLREACCQCRSWSEEGVSFGRIAVNLTGQQVNYKHFESDVLKIISETGADPRMLEFEFTETVLIDATDQTMGSIANLSNLGIHFAIDDFGTGFSSLSYLRKFATDKIKIDREFINDILTDPGAATIVSATIALGKTLGMVTLAEGVETLAQAEVLKKYGCDQAQGFLYGRSLSPQAIGENWLPK